HDVHDSSAELATSRDLLEITVGHDALAQCVPTPRWRVPTEWKLQSTSLQNSMPSKLRFLSVLALSTFLALPGVAQDAPVLAPTAGQSAELRGLWLTTAFPEMAVKAGESASISLNLRNEKLPPQRVTLSVDGAPEGWTTQL